MWSFKWKHVFSNCCKSCAILLEVFLGLQSLITLITTTWLILHQTCSRIPINCSMVPFSLTATSQMHLLSANTMSFLFLHLLWYSTVLLLSSSFQLHPKIWILPSLSILLEEQPFGCQFYALLLWDWIPRISLPFPLFSVNSLSLHPTGFWFYLDWSLSFSRLTDSMVEFVESNTKILFGFYSSATIYF